MCSWTASIISVRAVFLSTTATSTLPATPRARAGKIPLNSREKKREQQRGEEGAGEEGTGEE
ncbi:MAG: hypothetical protein LBI70_00430 [Rickettsiales bacterium]|nr:hypothetical protein [Rickettsiales bacterium]